MVSRNWGFRHGRLQHWSRVGGSARELLWQRTTTRPGYSTLTNFAFTPSGAITTKSHLQSVVVGPRVFFSTDGRTKYKLNPFGEAQFGVSHLSQDVRQVGLPTLSASDRARLAGCLVGCRLFFQLPLVGRANLDFLRTHLGMQGKETEASPRVSTHSGPRREGRCYSLSRTVAKNSPSEQLGNAHRLRTPWRRPTEE